MKGAKPQGGPPNMYYDHGKARQTFHPLAGSQTANGYLPIQNRQGGPQNFANSMQAPPMDLGLSNSQVIRFMDGVMESLHDDILPFQMAIGEDKSQWPPHTNAFTYELRSVAHLSKKMSETPWAQGGSLIDTWDLWRRW